MGINAWTDTNYYISASFFYLDIFHMNIKINILILDSDLELELE